MFGPGKGYVWWTKIGVKWGSTVIVASLNVDGGLMGLDQVMQKGKLAFESHPYPFT